MANPLRTNPLARVARSRRNKGENRLDRTREIFTRQRQLHPNTLYILPNLFTSASLFLALFSMVKVAEGNIVLACWLIVFAAVCDAIDGPVARLTNTTSNFGLQLDSLADMVAFGVAPAFLMYMNLRSLDVTLLPTYAPKLALGACALYAICSAIRLARFNVQAETTEKRWFTGLPTPGAAGMVVATYLFINWMAQTNVLIPNDTARLLHRCILLLMVGLSLLMVSDIRFPKLRYLLSMSKNSFNTFVTIIVLVCVLITFQTALPAFLFLGFSAYLLYTIGSATYRHFRKTADSDEPSMDEIL